jgi:nucleolar protein 15
MHNYLLQNHLLQCSIVDSPHENLFKGSGISRFNKVPRNKVQREIQAKVKSPEEEDKWRRRISKRLERGVESAAKIGYIMGAQVEAEDEVKETEAEVPEVKEAEVPEVKETEVKEVQVKEVQEEAKTEVKEVKSKKTKAGKKADKKEVKAKEIKEVKTKEGAVAKKRKSVPRAARK